MNKRIKNKLRKRFTEISASEKNVGTNTQIKNDTDKININSATLEESQSLPGVGQNKAQAIIEYRTVNGPFASIEDITNVSGIGTGKLIALRSMICC